MLALNIRLTEGRSRAGSEHGKYQGQRTRQEFLHGAALRPRPFENLGHLPEVANLVLKLGRRKDVDEGGAFPPGVVDKFRGLSSVFSVDERSIDQANRLKSRPSWMPDLMSFEKYTRLRRQRRGCNRRKWARIDAPPVFAAPHQGFHCG